MPLKTAALPPLLALLAGSAFHAFGCSGSDETTDIAGPSGTPSLRIGRKDGDCIAIGPRSSTDEPAGAQPELDIPITLSVENLLVRPPGTCRGAVQCGHLRLLIDDAVNNVSADLVVDAKLGRLAEAERYGDHKITIEVLEDSGEGVLELTGQPPLKESVTLSVQESCGEGGDAGDGSGDG